MRTCSGLRRPLFFVTLVLALLAANPAVSQLTAPGNVAAIPVHGQRIDLSWDSSAGSPQGYRVARQCASGDAEGYCTIAVLADPAAQSYQDVGVEEGTAYQYRVEAYSAATSEAAFVSATTLSPTSLPVEPNPDSVHPHYFEPQGVWTLGPAVSLAGFENVRLVHNLESDADLRILLRPAEPLESPDPENNPEGCRQHSLVGRLTQADYAPSIELAYTASPAADTVEVYLHHLDRAAAGTAPLPAAVGDFGRMGDEGYVLVAEPAASGGLRIVVGASSPRALFRGAMTVQRLLVDDTLCGPRASIEPVVVLDYPDHSFRGSSPGLVKMNSNYSSVPPADLELLDSLSRAGATMVEWGNYYAVQEEVYWNHTGARSTAAYEIAAAERFIEVKHWLGASAITFGTLSGDVTEPSALSLSQVPYGDGLAVLEEPFSWVETSTGSWQALSERQGTLHTRDTSMLDSPAGASGSPWVAESCSAGTWSHDTAEGRAGFGTSSFRLDGPASDCGLVQTLDVTDAFAPGRGFLSAWVKVSGDVENLSGALRLEVVTASGPTEFSVDFPPGLSSGAFTQVTLAIADLNPLSEEVTAASLRLRASMDAGALWVDDVTLHEWERESFPFGSFPDSSGWNPSCGPGTFEFDASKGHRDSASLKMTTPMDLGYEDTCAIGNFNERTTCSSDSDCDLTVADDEGGECVVCQDGEDRDAHLAQRYYAMRFEPGRYVLGAWIKAEWEGPPEVPDDGDQDGLADSVETNTGEYIDENDTGTDPNNPDTDGDGHVDGFEVLKGANPVKPGSRPRDSMLIEADVNVFLYDLHDEAITQDSVPIRKEYFYFPGSTNVRYGSWYYHAHVFDLSAEEAARTKSIRLQFRAWDKEEDEGTYWIDDVQVRRLDGDLRNLLGASQPPILRSASGTAYVEGVDYEVCQVGTTDTQCTPPLNYTQILEGGLTSSYNEDRPPFKIRWLSPEFPDPPEPPEERLVVSYDQGAQYASISKAGVDWDGTVFTRGSLNFCDVEEVFSGINLEAVFARLMDSYVLENFTPNGGEDYILDANLVTWSVSEVRGINRSLSCLDGQGEPNLSNAALFANVVNRSIALAKALEPDVRFVLWDDMFNPFQNGGAPDYQLKYGGVTGRSACSYAPHQLGDICADEVAEVAAGKFVPIIENEGLVMEPWSYTPNLIRRMVATSSWYEGLGVASHVLPGDHPVNVDDWAGIAHAFDRIEGVVATKYIQSEGFEGEPGFLSHLQAFWNHDWKLLYLHDNETPASSFYQIPWSFEPTLTLVNVTADTSGDNATATGKFAGNNDGGLEFETTGPPTVSLDGVPVHGGRRYRVEVNALRKGTYHSSEQTQNVPVPSFTVLWSSGESTGSLVSERNFDSSAKKNPDWWDRYRIEVLAPEGATAMTVEMAFGTGGEIVAADDILIFESIPRCFEACSLDLFGQDSDGDGLSDGWEIEHGFNPNVASEESFDPDLDGLINLEEQNAGTDPNNADTDGDGASDGQEVSAGTDPLDAGSFPETVPSLSGVSLGVLTLFLLCAGLVVGHIGRVRESSP